MEYSPEHTFENCKKITRIEEKRGITEDIFMGCFKDRKNYNISKKFVKEVLERKLDIN